jgi:uncharacterized cofD-like protein
MNTSDIPLQKKNIVVIGGGTGTFTVLSGLRVYSESINLSAVVSTADSGGSSGRLRDEFGYLPVGDARMALIALADDTAVHHDTLRKLFLYRFTKGGEHLKGHNVGNLLLVALTDILGSEEEAIKYASYLLRTRGHVLPVTLADIELVATYDDGIVVHGEADIDEPPSDRDHHRITQLDITPACTITPRARKAICEADLIVLGPGDLYTSILATCIVPGVKDAVQVSNGKLVYIANLMSKRGQTTGMTVTDCIRELERYLSRVIDVSLINTTALPSDLIRRYEETGEFPVANDCPQSAVEADLLGGVVLERSSGDAITRSLIRHDSLKLAAALMAL